MAGHQLSEGTILDERYKIEAVLGEGGFGITYAAVNMRTNLTVAVKELFWRGHVKRISPDSPEISVLVDEETDDYHSIKDKFLREARLLRDFENEPGVVRVLDYFEANNTAYLVMEYLDGLTLRKFIKKNGIFDPEELFRRLLPLLESLDHIHNTGVIHRDISPDNIMISADGSLKLLDFGSARSYKAASDAQYTTIVRENYAPPEQFDRGGDQGPWTDIYALCASIYECVVGSPPESALQRMFLDEIKSPSQMGARLDSSYEKIIMKGLQMNAGDRFSNIAQMKKAVEAALPAIVEGRSQKRRIIAGVLACVGAAAVITGIFLYREYDRTHKFRNIETETFRLSTGEEMTDPEFTDYCEVVEERLIQLAGEDNYIIETDGNSIIVTLPLEEFENQPISQILEEQFVYINEEKPFLYDYEIHADWEDPAGSLTAGENQCLPDEVTGTTLTQVYSVNSGSSAAQMTRGQWSNLLTDMKLRLDSLETPYALGLLYGDDSKIVVKIAAEHTGEDIISSLGKNILTYIRGKWAYDSIPLVRNSYVEGGTQLLSVEESAVETSSSSAAGSDVDSSAENNTGKYTLCVKLTNSSDISQLQSLSEYCLQSGKTQLYLDIDYGDYIASTNIDAPLTDGTLSFDYIYTDSDVMSDKDVRILLQYVCTAVNETDLPVQLFPADYMLQDSDGNILFGASPADYYGISFDASPKEKAFEALTERITRGGWDITRADGTTAWIQLGSFTGSDTDNNDLQTNGGFRISEAFQVAADFINRYGLSEPVGSFYLCLTEEAGDERCRIIISDSVVDRKMEARLVMVGETMAPYFDEARDAWQNLSLGADILMSEPMLEAES